MFVGHDGISFAAPRSGVRLPLWAFFVAVRWLDVVWWLLVLMGIEKLRITPGFTQANALDLYYMPFTHSLPGALALSAIFAGAVAMFATTGLRDCFCWSQPLVFRIGCSTASCARPIWRSMMMRPTGGTWSSASRWSLRCLGPAPGSTCAQYLSLELADTACGHLRLPEGRRTG